MTITMILAALMLIWLLALLIAAFGTALSLKHLATPPLHLDAPFNLFPVTVLKPLKGSDSGLRENLKSFFELSYPNYEIIFSVADSRDPAFDVISDLMRRHPRIPARLVVGDVKVGPNPKINNMVRGYQQAKYDWILISDSNIRVSPDYLTRLVANLDPGVGIMTSIVAGRNAQGAGGLLEESFLNTFYARGMVLAFSANQPIVMGKSIMFRKSTAERFGGIKILSRYLAEDYIAGEAVRHLGLRAVLASDPVVQYIGDYSFKEFWHRHLRWGRIRKAQSPLTFVLEPLFTCFGSGALGAFAAIRLFHFSCPTFIATHLLLWASCDFLMMKKLSCKIDIGAPIVWFLREFLALPLWLHIASGDTVEWRGKKMRLQSGGILEAS
jgi:ceramide glucosyltransferase